MTESSQISDDSSLRAQARANVSLARALVRDAHTAEDVAQDAWVAWLSAPVQRSSNWLRGALRNLARRSHRDQQRQALVPPPSATSSPPTDEVVAQIAMQRDIAEALLAIGEPYRTVLVLRFWHDLPPRLIAARLERPLATVKTQLQRGLCAVRAQLDRRHGRQHWMAALAPLAMPSTTTAGIAATIGVGLAMKKLLLVLTAALVLLGVGVGYSAWFDSESAAPDMSNAPQQLATSDATATPAERLVGGAETERTPVLPSLAPPGPTSTANVVGRVLSTEWGRPLAGAEVSLTDFGRWDGLRPRTATTGPDGRFLLKAPLLANGSPGIQGQGVFAYLSAIDRERAHARWVLSIDVPKRNQLATGTWDVGDIQLVRGVGLAGRIVSQAGETLPVRAGLFAWGSVEQRGMNPLFQARKVGETRPDGTFVLDARVGPAEGNRYCVAAVWRQGVAWAYVGVVAGQRDDLEVDLVAMPTDSMVVTVLDPDRKAVAGAMVTANPRFAPLGMWPTTNSARHLGGYPVLLALFQCTTDALGRAEFATLPSLRDPRLLAIPQNGLPDYAIAVSAKGYLKGVLGKLHPRKGQQLDVSITLQRPRKVIIEGRVLDNDGQPIAGARVFGNGHDVEAHTAADGSYRLPSFDYGWHVANLLIDANGFRRKFIAVPLAGVKGGSSTSYDVTMTRLRPIAGVIVDDLNRPVVGASLFVSAKGSTAWRPADQKLTGTDGRFTISQAGEGELTLNVWPPEPRTHWKRPWSRPVRVGDQDVRFVLERDPTAVARLEVEVVDWTTGELLAPTDASLITKGKPLATGIATRVGLMEPTCHCSLGKVTSEGLPPGRYRLRVAVENHGWAEHEFEIAANQRRVTQRVRIGPPGVIVGEVDFSRMGGRDFVMLQLGPRERAVSRLPTGELERVTPGATIVRSAKRTSFRFESVTPNKALTIQAPVLPGLGKIEVKVRPGEKVSVVFPPKR